MWWYFIVRIGIFLLAFVGWLGFQMLVRRKGWKEVSNDAYAIGFFLGAWALIVWWLY